MSKKIYKSNKKNIKLLNKCKFRIPYQLILDDTFIYNSNKFGKRYKHLTEIFKSEPKLFFTKCIYNKYKELNKSFDHDLSAHCEFLECKHKNKSDVLRCLKFIFRNYNKNHYIICTANKEIIDFFKKKRDVPILNFYNGQIKLYLTDLVIPKMCNFVTEASERELNRLKRIFNNEENSDIETEKINIDELEISDEDSEINN